MNRWRLFFLSCSIAIATITATAQTSSEPPVLPSASSKVRLQAVPTNNSFPVLPTIEAKAYLLIDMNSGQILAEQDADAPIAPASLTKLMTAYLTFEAIQQKRLALDQHIMISQRAYDMGGSRMFVEKNAMIPAEDLIKGMIVQSGNDATVALAEAVGGTVENFVAMMNTKAKELGLKNTSYRNPEGLDAEGHLTTARDLAILSERIMKDFPEGYGYYALKEFTHQPKPDVKPITQPNRNLLLHIDPTVDGLKTGHTNAAGYSLISSSAREFPNISEKRRLLSILLGAKDETARAQESQKLLNWGFQAWDDVQLFAAEDAVKEARVWQGKSKTAKLGAFSPIVVSVPHGQAARLKATVNYSEPLMAPLEKGQPIGTISISLDTPEGLVELRKIDLVVIEEVKSAGFFGRLWDSIVLWFSGLFS